jgi:Domain of unknown function (DUF4126)
MDITQTIALSMGVAWASGINLYAAIVMLGYLGSTGNIDLPPELQILTNPAIMLAAGVLYCIEFFADKVPGIDTGWDLIQTFVRIPAGAVLAAGAIGDVGTGSQLAAALTGGTLATGSHFVKAGGRVIINTSPEPFTNWFASVGEDIAVIAGLWTALHHPLLFLLLLGLFIMFMLWLLPRIWRGIRKVLASLGRLAGMPGSVTENKPPSISKTRK